MRTNFVAMLLVCCAAVALFATPVGAANFQEDFDAGFPDDTPLNTTDSTWFDAFGPGQFTGQVRSYDVGSGTAPSGSFVMGADALNTTPIESLVSYPTGINSTDTDVLAQYTVVKGSAGHIGIALSPTQDSGTVNQRFRDAPGSVLALYTPGFGSELYAIDDGGALSNDGRSNATLLGQGIDLGGLAPGSEIIFQLKSSTASGPTTVTLDASIDGGSNFSQIGTRSLGSAWNPANVGFVLSSDNVADDIIVSSVPEPTAIALMLGGLVVLVMRRRR